MIDSCGLRTLHQRRLELLRIPQQLSRQPLQKKTVSPSYVWHGRCRLPHIVKQAADMTHFSSEPISAVNATNLRSTSITPFHVNCLELPKPFSPGVYRDIAHPVLLGHFRHGQVIRLAPGHDRLFLRVASSSWPRRFPKDYCPKLSTGAEAGAQVNRKEWLRNQNALGSPQFNRLLT